MTPTTAAERVRVGLRDRLARLGLAPLDAAAFLLAVGVGAAVFAVSTDLFAYHSVNDDEGVYLLQAAMLLEGRLFLRPPAGLADLVRPWFFVVDATPAGPRMYSKYAPVPAATFALGQLAGDAHLSLAGVGAGIALGTYLVGRAVADRPTGLVAAGLLASSPLFLVTGSTFLPYAPTALWTTLFAAAYLFALDRDSLPLAAAAGVAVGVAFFARPYTAVLFAAPFVGHTCWRLWRAWRAAGWDGARTRRAVALASAIAAPGLAFVGVTLAYNAVLTGHATTFPYEAFAPRDGLGFGRREILGYTEQYTPALGVEATREALGLFVTRFGPLGLLGGPLAAAGAAVVVAAAGRDHARAGADDRPTDDGAVSADEGAVSADEGAVSADDGAAALPAVDGTGAALLGGVAASVVLGNVYFWGTLNGLRNGLIDLLGPFYHFDLLLPVSVFGAVALVTLARRLRAALGAHLSPRGVRVALLVVLACSAPVVVAAERDALSEPWRENHERTENLAATYEPFEDRSLENALVYTPDPYGDWQQHPFQYLRNDPGFDGPRLFVLDEGPDADVRALDATDRTPYRFTYRGEWTGAVTPVDPRLRRLRVLDGERVAASARFGAPAGATAASVRIETEEGFARYRVADGDGPVRVEWTVTPAGVAVTNHPRAAGPARVPLPDGASEVDVVVRYATTGGASVTYRQEATLDATAAGVRVIWPPETRVCRLRPECGTEGTWVGPDGDYLDGVSVETDARVVAG